MADHNFLITRNRSGVRSICILCKAKNTQQVAAQMKEISFVDQSFSWYPTDGASIKVWGRNWGVYEVKLYGKSTKSSQSCAFYL